jgi:GT2 family glycosyltransferase
MNNISKDYDSLRLSRQKFNQAIESGPIGSMSGVSRPAISVHSGLNLSSAMYQFGEVASQQANQRLNELRDELRAIEGTKWFRIREMLLGPKSVLRSIKSPPNSQVTQVDFSPNENKAQWSHDSYESWDAVFQRPSAIEDAILQRFYSHHMSSSDIAAVIIITERYLNKFNLDFGDFFEQWTSFQEIIFVADDSIPDSWLDTLEFGSSSVGIKRVVNILEVGVWLSEVISDSKCEWISVFEPGYKPRKWFVSSVFEKIRSSSSVEMIYSDEDRIDGKGTFQGHFFASDWNELQLYASNCLGHAITFRRTTTSLENLKRMPVLEYSTRYLCLILSSDINEKNIYHLPRVLGSFLRIDECTEEDLQLLKSLLNKRNYAVSKIWKDQNIVTFRVQIDKKPKVSILIPTRDRVELLEACIASIYKVTEYPDFEIIIIDNDSVSEKSLRFFEDISKSGRAKVIESRGPFNFSRLNNLAALHSNGEILVLLNNDTEIIESDWLSNLVAYAVRPEIGVVGARLLYPDRTVQHGGVVVGLGVGGCARHSFVGLGEGDPGYLGKARSDQWISAVTGACHCIRKELLLRVGGLDEEAFPVAFNDIDLCLKCQYLGFKNVYAGSVTLIHHESKSRASDLSPENFQRYLGEIAAFTVRWHPQFADPYYNINLSLDSVPYTLAWPPRSPMICC